MRYFIYFNSNFKSSKKRKAKRLYEKHKKSEMSCKVMFLQYCGWLFEYARENPAPGLVCGVGLSVGLLGLTASLCRVSGRVAGVVWRLCLLGPVARASKSRD